MKLKNKRFTHKGILMKGFLVILHMTNIAFAQNAPQLEMICDTAETQKSHVSRVRVLFTNGPENPASKMAIIYKSGVVSDLVAVVARGDIAKFSDEEGLFAPTEKIAALSNNIESYKDNDYAFIQNRYFSRPEDENPTGRTRKFGADVTLILPGEIIDFNKRSGNYCNISLLQN